MNLKAYRLTTLGLVLGIGLAGASWAWADDSLPSAADGESADSGAPTSAAEPLAVAARVDGQPVYRYEVERAMRRTFGDRELDPGAVPGLRKKALEQLIDQRLIVQWLRRRGQEVSEADFRLAWSQLESDLADKGVTLPEYLQQSGRGEAELRHALWWQIGWSRFLENYLTDANLQKYFEQHRREFDGTRLRVAQIFWKSDSAADVAAFDKLLQRAEQVGEAIRTGEISFARAAVAHSEAPSGQQGGEIGWIERRRPMPDEFARAAFALEPGDTSQAVVSPLGVHLIKLLEIEPGKRQWNDARAELEQAATRYLFRWAAEQQRPHSRIELVELDLEGNR